MPGVLSGSVVSVEPLCRIAAPSTICFTFQPVAPGASTGSPATREVPLMMAKLGWPMEMLVTTKVPAGGAGTGGGVAAWTAGAAWAGACTAAVDVLKYRFSEILPDLSNPAKVAIETTRIVNITNFAEKKGSGSLKSTSGG